MNSYLRWQSADKNTTLVTRLTTETLNVVENADIPIEDRYSGAALIERGLDDCRWLNEKYIVKFPLTVAQLNAVDAAPNGLVKLSTNEYGWILSLKTKNEDGMAEAEILRCNTDVVTPV